MEEKGEGMRAAYARHNWYKRSRLAQPPLMQVVVQGFNLCGGELVTEVPQC